MLFERAKIEPDEEVVATIRKHWFVLFEMTALIGFLFVLPYLFFAFADNITPLSGMLVHVDFSSETMLYIFAAWSLLTLMLFFNALTDYYLDVWIITNRRIVAIDQQGLFHRIIGSFRIERLQDVNVKIEGIIATALDFGTLEVETAGHDHDFQIKGIPEPREVKSLILNIADQVIDRKPNREIPL